MTSSAIGRTFLHSEGLSFNSDTEKLLLIQSISNEHKSGISGMPILNVLKLLDQMILESSFGLYMYWPQNRTILHFKFFCFVAI